ncbi:MAG TPA: DUF6221 family protein [Candidatus Limnocylindrales bacterium]|nr:DUF6221 family protein [Candidatus Limnocylindrales bacterium]
MNDLFDKLRAAIDEDERIALKAAERVGPKWTLRQHGWPDPYSDGIGAERGDVVSSGEVMVAEGDHIVQWDPQAVLDLIAAHRKILDWYERLIAANSSDRADLAERAALWLVTLILAERYGIETDPS